MRCRLMLVLLFMCVADSKALVFNNFQECTQFFYNGIWPQGLDIDALQTSYYSICQRYGGKDHFATLYMLRYRIPLFSAYRLDNFKCNGTQNSRMKQWFIEPQLSFTKEMGPIWDMKREHEYDVEWSNNQAVNGDYRNTNYDRGHLNPSFYQCDNARTATFTLTNAVPQDPCFNRQKWFEMEKTSKQIMKDECKAFGDQRFFVTGVIPSNTSIPFPEHDNEGDQFRDYKRVDVPYAMWTAACCDSQNDQNSFSFSYVGFNRPNSLFYAFLIPDLLRLLNTYGFNDVQIFADNCFPYNTGSVKALNTLVNTIDARTSAGSNVYPAILKQWLFYHNNQNMN